MLRRLAACSIAAVLATAAFGAAASLGVSADFVGAGEADASASCAVSTNDVVYSYSGANLSSVQVMNLPTSCRGGKVWLALLNASDGLVAQAGPVDAIDANGSSATFNFTDLAAASVKRYSIAVVK